MATSDIVVVTGASAGVGRATAVEFARRGARLALLARGVDGLEGARREVENAGGSALAISTDVSDPDQVERAAEQVERELGPIAIWVNCAMATVFSPVSAITPEEFRRVTEVTYLGYVYGTLAALKRMRTRNRGTIVQVGSALAYRAIPLQSAYCGAKFAIRGFTDSLRSELIHDRSKIQLTMVQIAAFNTPQFDWARIHIGKNPQPVPPIFQPEVAARGIVHAACRPRREFWIGWPTVKAILGNKLIPGLLDRYLASKAYEGQFGPEPLPSHRPDNLFAPVPGDHGTHGRFDQRAKPWSGQLWANMHRGWLAAGATVMAGLILWRWAGQPGRRIQAQDSRLVADRLPGTPPHPRAR
jgi:NAD(P)-dependent dehydrogenase (short-subunit alcohol dehydrogenase family)